MRILMTWRAVMTENTLMDLNIVKKLFVSSEKQTKRRVVVDVIETNTQNQLFKVNCLLVAKNEILIKMKYKQTQDK